MATPTIIGTPTSQAVSAGANPWTQSSFTVSGAGSNRALIVVMHNQAGDAAPTSVTWNAGGEALTKIIDLTYVQEASMRVYYLANPTATTADVVLNFAGNRIGAFWCVVYQDMVQTSGSVVDVSGQSNNASTTHPTVAITTTVANDIVLSFNVSNIGALVMTPDAPQNQIASEALTTGNYRSNLSDMPAVSTGSLTTGFTYSGSTVPEDMFAFALKYVASGTNYTQTLTEAITVSDTITRSITRVLTEAVTNTDVLNRSITRLFTEAITLSTVFAGGRGFVLTLTESISVTDSLRVLLNGTDVIWTKITKSAAAVWTKITRS